MCSARKNQVNSKYFKKLKIEEGRGGRRKEKVRHSQLRTNFMEKKTSIIKYVEKHIYLDFIYNRSVTYQYS